MEQWYTFEDDTKTNVKMKSRLILNINSGNADVIKTFLVTSKKYGTCRNSNYHP